MQTTVTTRKMNASNTGTASYVFANDEAPAWLVSAVPGAAKAREAWIAENAKGRELSRVARESGKALVALRNSRPLAAELALAEREHADKDRAVAAQARRALAALKKFDATVYGADLTPAEYRAMAAEHALAKHAEAVAAWETLTAALGERDVAWTAAGTPGLHWVTRTNALPGDPLGSEAKSEKLLAARVEGFDVEAVQRAASGDAVKSAAEIHTDATAAAEEARAKSAAAARKRSHAQGF